MVTAGIYQLLCFIYSINMKFKEYMLSNYVKFDAHIALLMMIQIFWGGTPYYAVLTG
jgi:hypothetical protein